MQLKAMVICHFENKTVFDIDGYDYTLPINLEHYQLGKYVIITVEPETFDPPPFRGEQPMAHHMVM